MSTQAATPVHSSLLETRKRMLAYALQRGLSLAIWRLPNQPSNYILLSDKAVWLEDLAIEELNPGFVMSPFNPTEKKLYLEGQYLFEMNEMEIRELTQTNFLEESTQTTTSHKSSFYTQRTESIHQDDDYSELVKLAVNAIEAGAFDKVVPSKTRFILVDANFDLLQVFDRLCIQYPTAMISLVSNSEIGTWIGASPELLVSTDKRGIFRTVALAGTQPYLEGTSLRSISWTQKEIEEQALVERYIISCFKKIRVREYEEHGPKTVQAGKLLHLRSDFEVNMAEVNYPQLGSIMLKLLHPTSAVCGMPMQGAYQFLEANEGYDREYYSGYLGPVNINGESHIYVNLRCAKWHGNYIQQFAGAGVTIDSVPESECREVNIKLDTVLKAMGVTHPVKP